MFKKRNNNRITEVKAKSESLFVEVVRETNELYEDLKSEYEAIENVIAEFAAFANEFDNLDKQQKVKLEELILQLRKVDRYAQKSLREVGDLLRNHKKILREIKREQ